MGMQINFASFLKISNNLNSLTFSSSNRNINLNFTVETIEFDPRVMLLNNKLTPVAIDNYPSPQQALWLFNPYSTVITLQLISNDSKLAIIDDVIVVKQSEHTAVRMKFNPRIVGSFEVKFAK